MKIKASPADFYVEEIIEPKITGEGEYTYFWLTKTNWTTQRAINQIARLARVSRKRFRIAGTKDKLAVTKQVVCAWRVESNTLERVKLKDIRIDIIGKSDVQLTLGDLTGNRFTIIIRELSNDDIRSLNKNSKTVSKGMLNLFGSQRFGRGNTHLIGKQIILGNMSEAVRLILAYASDDETQQAKDARRFAAEHWGSWQDILQHMPKFLGIEKSILNHLVRYPNDFAGALRTIPKPLRMMYIHAFQSELWNKALLKTKARGKLIVPGYDSKLGKIKFDTELKRLLASEGVELDDFQCKVTPELKSAGNFRNGRVKPREFSYKIEGDTAILQFELPKGCYATTVLDALFKL